MRKIFVENRNNDNKYELLSLIFLQSNVAKQIPKILNINDRYLPNKLL